MVYNRLNRMLRVHYNNKGKLLCMPNKSNTYLYPHLTKEANEVTCQSGTFWKHLHIEHTCICGRVVKGNAFYNHAKHCPFYQGHIFSADRETRRLTIDPQGLKVLGLKRE